MSLIHVFVAFQRLACEPRQNYLLVAHSAQHYSGIAGHNTRLSRPADYFGNREPQGTQTEGNSFTHIAYHINDVSLTRYRREHSLLQKE